jgi:TolA-binding protein
MKLWPLFSLILLGQPALHAQDAAGFRQKGDDALADGLWEIAELHFRKCLADSSLTPEAKSQIAVRLAESLVRAGNFPEALELLNQSFVAKNPETPFWKALALAGQNQFAEAVELFTHLLANPAAPHRTEASFSRANLQLALGQSDAALLSLADLRQEADAATAVKARLQQVEILLDLARPADARKALPEPSAIAAAVRPLAAFLEAQLLLRENHPVEAEAAFRELVNHSQGQSLARYHAAAIGLADSINAQGKSEVAAKSLLAFLQEHPDSPVLEAMFRRILQWLPDKPTTTDPILESLAQWITPPVLPAPGPVATIETNAIGAWVEKSAPPASNDRLIFSLYARAIGLHRVATPEALAESRRLFTRLRIENPNHPLANRALYQQARWLLDAGSVDAAFAALNTLREVTTSPILKGESAFLEAQVAYQNGNSKQAIQLFDEAALLLAAPEARSAKLHAAIARLRSNDLQGVTLIQQPGVPEDKSLEADLALERALLTTPLAAAKTAIEEFLTKHPDHPRASEARLAAAEAALTGPSPDPAFASAQLEALNAATDVPAPRVALARLRVADLSNDPAATIAAAQAVINTYPAAPEAAEATLTLGRNLFQTGSYNPARLVLEKLAASDNDPTRSQAAWLLAARAAALGGTPQSKDEALILFDKAIKAKGPLAAIATLEKAGHLIDMNRLAEASEFLGKWIKSLPENDPLRLPAGLLLGESLYAQGSTNPASLVEALAVYDKLLAQAKNQPILFNRLQYLRGMTLQQLPDEKDPKKTRETQAFEAFHSVLETANPPAEWEYFERCAFSALAILEKAKRWEAAVNIARKIASFKGPRAEEAAARASKIQLEQMMW